MWTMRQIDANPHARLMTLIRVWGRPRHRLLILAEGERHVSGLRAAMVVTEPSVGGAVRTTASWKLLLPRESTC